MLDESNEELGDFMLSVAAQGSEHHSLHHLQQAHISPIHHTQVST